ncbi:exodeoxyribonuclease VII large subunit [Geomesophilobacter sediminis]|uniref:Exodeoxyribonuclease 7 large subunit n=1 Tax=Geomesophilobacter sediminis TaxID=2798584 RepID=A0A8J7LZ80_9BACT|nr:exodeoxyribonuclease VII large subunit [Geomesophilobacter sediminis]MBJ6726307.1 exodeoxyribonuclease VII large subunit [Geomesophilobacter sediminis]
MELFKERRVLTVTQLTGLIRGVLEENFDRVWVEGEISNLSCPQSGHVYFTLKDAGAQLRCVMFRSSARSVTFQPKDGMRVLVRGRITLYEPRGEYQMVADALEPQGIGALQLAFIQLKERLAREGLFSETHKREIPKLPRRIGVVTSPTGAAIRDILTVLSRRFANVEVLIAPVKVQGEGAAKEIAAAIADLNRYGSLDVMIVGRGGGSLEDLWAFNEEVVARAIHESAIPVISAVGHEIDFTIADFVADLRAATPSAAAELVVQSKAELTADLDARTHRLIVAMERILGQRRAEVNYLSRSVQDPSRFLGHLIQRTDDLQARVLRQGELLLVRRAERIEGLANRLALQNPALQLEKVRERLGTLELRLIQAKERRLAAFRDRLKLNAGKLHAVSPLATLTRGYSIVQKLPELSVVTSAAQLNPGDRLKLVLSSGSAHCKVDAVQLDESLTPPPTSV